jgi:hypothetical protein
LYFATYPGSVFFIFFFFLEQTSNRQIPNIDARKNPNPMPMPTPIYKFLFDELADEGEGELGNPPADLGDAEPGTEEGA